MNINEFKRILTTFADEASDVDVRLGKVVAQIREDLIDASIRYSEDQNYLIITENGQDYPARNWLINRVARLPQLAERIISHTNELHSSKAGSPFIVPSGFLSADLSIEDQGIDTQISNAVEVLLTKASNPLPGATSVLYITSDAGEGKTTVINHIANQQAQKYKSKLTSTLIVPIPLGGRAFLTFDDAVIAALVNKLRFSYLYYDAFVELVRMGAIIPAFDGYEEMLVEGTKSEAISALGNLVQTLESSGTVFIAARKAFFEYLSFRTQAKLFDAIGNRSVSFSRIAIARWDEKKFCEYGSLRGVDDAKEIYNSVASRLDPNHPLLTRAVLIRRLYDVTLEEENRSNLAELLGSRPQDYFFTFVDAIIKREASEKWLSRVSGEVMEPLLTVEEHHLLLSVIAQEMWQTSSRSIRYDIIDVLVDIFAEELGKNAGITRQIKERLKQHSLLVADSSRSNALAFDHEDFQDFYVGESLGRILSRGTQAELQSFLSVNILAIATIEQAVQFLLRNYDTVNQVLKKLLDINRTETGFSFCKENCGVLVVRILECTDERSDIIALESMFLSPEILFGRKLEKITFHNCHFQPSLISKVTLREIEFNNCEFERLEINHEEQLLSGCNFVNCTIDSLAVSNLDESSFDPAQIKTWLKMAGASVDHSNNQQLEGLDVITEDESFKIFQKFLRIFIRSTQADEDVIRLRLGGSSPKFFDEILPSLLDQSIIEEVPWKGRGSQHRYKLTKQMSQISLALEKANGSLVTFLAEIK